MTSNRNFNNNVGDKVFNLDWTQRDSYKLNDYLFDMIEFEFNSMFSQKQLPMQELKMTFCDWATAGTYQRRE